MTKKKIEIIIKQKKNNRSFTHKNCRFAQLQKSSEYWSVFFQGRKKQTKAEEVKLELCPPASCKPQFDCGTKQPRELEISAVK